LVKLKISLEIPRYLKLLEAQRQLFLQDEYRPYLLHFLSPLKIRHTVGQPLAPTTQTSFLYGFQAPILIKVEIDEAVDVAIYPNPVNETLHINIPKLDYTFTIHSLSGKLLVSGLLNQKQNDISLQKLSKGIYALRVYNAFERVQAVAKIIKE